MTNFPESIDELQSHARALIDADLLTYDPDDHACFSASFRLTITIMRAAALELAHSLTLDAAQNNELTSFYFSDSSYDEICNPSYIIDLCSTAIACFYEIPDNLSDAMHEIADNIESIYFPDEFDAAEFPNLDALSNLIADNYKFPRIDFDAFPFHAYDPR